MVDDLPRLYQISQKKMLLYILESQKFNLSINIIQAGALNAIFRNNCTSYNYDFDGPKFNLAFLGATNMDNFPEELREVVNDHWGKYPPAHPLIVSFFGIFYLFVTVVCVGMNGLLCYIFIRTKSLRTPVIKVS